MPKRTEPPILPPLNDVLTNALRYDRPFPILPQISPQVEDFKSESFRSPTAPLPNIVRQSFSAGTYEFQRQNPHPNFSPNPFVPLKSITVVRSQQRPVFSPSFGMPNSSQKPELTASSFTPTESTDKDRIVKIERRDRPPLTLPSDGTRVGSLASSLSSFSSPSSVPPPVNFSTAHFSPLGDDKSLTPVLWFFSV